LAYFLCQGLFLCPEIHFERKATLSFQTRKEASPRFGLPNFDEFDWKVSLAHANTLQVGMLYLV
jgi:hypothetical protein